MNSMCGPRQTLCSTCGSPDTISVAMEMADGAVRFWTCAECEATGWQRDGSDIDRGVALANVPRR